MKCTANKFGAILWLFVRDSKSLMFIWRNYFDLNTKVTKVKGSIRFYYNIFCTVEICSHSCCATFDTNKRNWWKSQRFRLFSQCIWLFLVVIATPFNTSLLIWRKNNLVSRSSEPPCRYLRNSIWTKCKCNAKHSHVHYQMQQPPPPKKKCVKSYMYCTGMHLYLCTNIIHFILLPLQILNECQKQWYLFIMFA